MSATIQLIQDEIDALSERLADDQLDTSEAEDIIAALAEHTEAINLLILATPR